MPRTGWTVEELKSKALDAAERVIRNSGFERSKLTDVARELGISHAALYKHFDSKEALLDAVTARWLERIDHKLTDVAEHTGSAPERIRKWFLALHHCKREKILVEPELFRAFDMSSIKGSPAALAHLHFMQNQLTDLIQQGIKEGSLKTENPEQVAALLFEATMAYHHPRLVLEQLETDREPALNQLLDVLLSAYAP